MPLKAHRFKALGTVWHVQASEVLNGKLEQAESTAREFEQTFTRFAGDSLLMQLNNSGKLDSPPEDLLKMLDHMRQISVRTQGLFNPTAGAAISAQGYGPDLQSTYEPDWLSKASWSSELVELDGVKLDLGGLGKGYLIDKLYAQLASAGATNILVNGGGDMRYHFDQPTDIPLMMPGASGKYFKKLSVTIGAMASSSPLIRAWDGHNHLVGTDGQSYSGNITQVTVLADSCAEADGYATALSVCRDPLALSKELQLPTVVYYDDDRYAQIGPV